MNKLISTLFFLFSVSILLGQAESEDLSERVKDLESTLNWLKNWGIPLGGLSVFAVLTWLYMQFKGLKKKAEEEVAKALQNKLPSTVKEQIENHPIMSLFTQELEARKKPILIVSKAGKDQEFVDYLNKNGFTNTHSIRIDDLTGLDINDFNLILLDNRKAHKLSQEKMETVLTVFKEGCKYFYFNNHNQWWTPISDYAKTVKITGHASSIATLPNRLTEALKS